MRRSKAERRIPVEVDLQQVKGVRGKRGRQRDVTLSPESPAMPSPRKRGGLSVTPSSPPGSPSRSSVGLNIEQLQLADAPNDEVDWNLPKRKKPGTVGVAFIGQISVN